MDFDAFWGKLQAAHDQRPCLPAQVAACAWMDSIIELLFPARAAAPLVQSLGWHWAEAQHQLKGVLWPIRAQLPEPLEVLAERFFEQIPQIYALLCADAEAALQRDAAARSLEEVLVSYPGFYALCVHRLAHPWYKWGVPLLPRIWSEYAHQRTGIDIHAGAQIGEGCFIDHGTGTVIGETAMVGRAVTIFQGVTLGALHVRKSEADRKRHPTIEDRVIIYSGATILGGNTVVGADSVIGGNAWVTKSVPPHSLVYQQNTVQIRDLE